MDAEGNYLEESYVHHGVAGIYTPEEAVLQNNTAVIYLDMICHVWGHCLTDSLRRVWFFHSDFYKKDFKDLPIVYIPMGKGIVPSFAKILDILEIDPNKLIPITSPTKFKKIILPDESFFEITNGETGEQTVFFTKEYQETIQRVRDYGEKNFTQLSQKKFYFLYSGAESMGAQIQIGEENIANYFSSKGYSIISPQNFSFEEQLNMLLNCENFASTLGSISHNTIFMKDGREVIFIPRYPAYNVYQLALDTLQNLNIYYIDSSMSIFYQNWQGPHCYIVSEQLKKFFGDDFEGYVATDFIAFLGHMRLAMLLNYDKGQNVTEYYANIYENFLNQLKPQKDLIEKFHLSIN